jgi:CheY-like chemotaxis protein
VEDDAATRQALVDSLTWLNYQVIEASNGREALAILTAGENRIELVVSDVVMPVMGGIPLLRALRQQNLSIPVVLVTGHPMSKEMARLEGLAGWLPKPPRLGELANLLASILGA